MQAYQLPSELLVTLTKMRLMPAVPALIILTLSYLGSFALMRMISPADVGVQLTVSRENKDQQKTREMWFAQYLTYAKQYNLNIVQTSFPSFSVDLHCLYFLYILLCLFQFCLYISFSVVIKFFFPSYLCLSSLDLYNPINGIYFQLHCILICALPSYLLVSVNLCIVD